MGKKDQKLISLSEVDHKLQFINVVAVIGDITPIISRSKLLAKVELRLIDETVTKPGFNVKLNLESKMLDHFLNVAKRGFIIQLSDIKVTKNEGEVYGEVNEEEEVTLYNDSPHVYKWYPGEKPTAVADTLKLKVLSMVKWKKAHFKDIEALPEDDEEQTKTRRSGLGSDGKSQAASKIVGKANPLTGSAVSKNNTSKIKAINQNIEDKLTLQKENKLKDSPSIKHKLEIPTLRNEPTKRLRTNKSLRSSEEAESLSTSSSRASISSSPSRVTRAINASNLNKSLSLSSLNKLVSTKSDNKSLNLSRLKKSVSLSKVNKSESNTSLDDSRTSFRRSRIREGMKTKGESSENDPVKSTRLNRSRSLSKINKVKLSSDSDAEGINQEQNSLGSFSSASHKADKEYKTKKDKSKVDQTQRSEVKKNDNNLLLTTSKTSLPNKTQGVESSDEVETSEAENVDLNFKILTKSEIKETGKKSVSKDKLNTSETLKITRRKAEGSLSLSKTVGNDSKTSSPNNTSKVSKLESRTCRILRKRENCIGEQSNSLNRITTTRTKGADEVTDSPIRKKARLLLKSEYSSDTSSENSPKSRRKLGSLGKIPTLNSSNSTLSETSNPSVKNISSSIESFHKKKGECYEVDKSPKTVSKKKLKLIEETFTKKTDCFKHTLKHDSTYPVNEEEIRTHVKENEILPKRESNRKNDEVVKGNELLGKNTKLGPDLKKTQNKESLSSEFIISSKTHNQVLEKWEPNEDLNIKQTRNTAISTKEFGKCGVYEKYLRPLTKKLNFISVENITDISLYDLEEVDVPDKFDLQCKVVSEFVLVEDSIQVVRVQDGTKSKYGSLRIPRGPSWDVVLKEILDNPIVEEKSQYIDIIIFNYFRLDFPLKSDKFFRINNIMAVQFQLKKDPRQGKKSKRELFFCVEGQNANIKKVYPQKIKELKERLTSKPLESNLSATVKDKATVEKPTLDLVNFKLPNSPTMDVKMNLPSDGESPSKTKSVVEGPKLRKRNQTDSDSDIEHIAISERRKSPAGDKPRDKNDRKNFESNNDKNTEKKPQAKIDTTNSSDETMMSETPPLLREIKEIMNEESALGLPLTTSEDIHLKNSGSEVTFSQFCEGAKLKGDNFRTSTQGVEPDVLSADADSLIVSKSNHLPKDVSVASEEVVQLEDTSKMEPLVYCPSGSSVSSAVCASPDKGKTKQDLQDSQKCSSSVLQGAQLKTISNLKPCNHESQIVSNDNTSDLSSSSSVKVIGSNSSVGIYFKALGSKESNCDKEKTQSSTKVIVVDGEHNKSPEVKDLPSDAHTNVSLSLNKTPVLLKDKESESLLENGCISGNILNEESTNNEIEVVSDSSNASLLTAENNTTMKAASSFNASRNNDPTVHNLEQVAKMIPDRCFYKSPTTLPTLTELELNEIYDDEHSPVKYFSYCHNRDLPILTFDVIEKIKHTNSLTITVTFDSIIPAFTGCWRESCIKARCPSCDKFYDVFKPANNSNNENTSPMSAISVGSHIVCPESQCCNQILENPEFHFTVEFKLKDGTPLTALLAGKCAEDVFGCSAQEAMRNESALNRVAETLEKITKNIIDKHPTKVVVKRDDICDPKSGPLCLAHIS